MAIFTEELDCKFFRSLQANVNQNTVSIVRRVKNNIHSFYWIWIKTYLVLIYLFHGENLAIYSFYTSTVRLVDSRSRIVFASLCFTLVLNKDHVICIVQSNASHPAFSNKDHVIRIVQSSASHLGFSNRIFSSFFESPREFIFWESLCLFSTRVPTNIRFFFERGGG